VNEKTILENYWNLNGHSYIFHYSEDEKCVYYVCSENKVFEQKWLIPNKPGDWRCD